MFVDKSLLGAFIGVTKTYAIVNNPECEGYDPGKPFFWFLYTRISGLYGPFILAPAEGWWVGLRPISLAFGPYMAQ